jgi:alpha-tubulin suppressor-like RCC1 family protein
MYERARAVGASQRRERARCILALSALSALAACGGGSGDAASQPPASGASARLVSPGDGQFAWHIVQPAAVAMTDAVGHAVDPSALRCSAHDATQLVVAADCSRITALRIGVLTVDVTAGGATASFTLTGTPQRQWSGVHGVTSFLGSGSYGEVTSGDGEVLAWGANPSGVLGQGQDINGLASLPSPTAALDANGAPLRDILQASAGDRAVAALRLDGSLLAWGNNDAWELGNSAPVNQSLTPVSVEDLAARSVLGHVVQAEVGDSNSVALIDDGSVVAWGTWPGDGTTLSRTLPTQVKTPDGGSPLTHVVAVSAGASFSLVLGEDGQVRAWGYDLKDGRLGAGSTLNTPSPLPNLVLKSDGTPLDQIVQVSAGYDFSLALDADGSVWAWGDNQYGQLGQGSMGASVPTAVQVKAAGGGTLSGIAMVAAGGNHALALDRDGNVLAWGLATSGQLGDGPNRPVVNQSTLPRAVVGVTGGNLGAVQSIAAGYATSLALDGTGLVLSWGDNFRGALGRATTGPLDPTPGPVSGAGTATLTVDASRYPNLLRLGH